MCAVQEVWSVSEDPVQDSSGVTATCWPHLSGSDPFSREVIVLFYLFVNIGDSSAMFMGYGYQFASGKF